MVLWGEAWHARGVRSLPLAPALSSLALAVALSGLACFEDTPPPSGGEGTDESESTSEDEASSDEDTSAGTEVGTESTSESESEESTSEAETTEDESADTEPEPECGNGVVEDGEACDDGPEPPLAEGACKPDCSGVIETRQLLLGEVLSDGDLGNNPVATVDAACPVGFEAMFADGVARRATTTPWQSTDPIDWPVEPYTRYVNDQGEEVWVTDAVALIGIRDGGHVPITAMIADNGSCDPLCISRDMVSGLKDDGTTLTSDNCNGWSEGGIGTQGSVGDFETGEYVTGTVACNFNVDLLIDTYRPVCVEQ